MERLRPAVAALIGLLLIAAGCGSNAGPDGDLADGDTGRPEWPACASVEIDGTLADKAAVFDRIARELHLAGDGLLRNLYLAPDETTVDHWLHVENVILWSGIYLASQAFRHAVSGDPEATENAKTAVAALRQLTLVTGSSGLYGRSMLRPGVAYNPIPDGHPGWTDSPVPSLAGWRFRNDVSKDGYAGLMFGYAAALEHFDDPGLLADVRARLREVIDHIVGNGLRIVDWNGRVTEHGRLFHSALDDFPGFNALLAASFVKVAAEGLADPALDDFYYGCLLRTRATSDCPPIEDFDLGSYLDSMEERLFLFLPACQQNYDNFDMAYQAVYPLLRRERDWGVRARLLGVLRNGMFDTDNPDHQSIAPLGNAFFTFAFAALDGTGPGVDPVLDDAVERAVCTLKRFPARKIRRMIPAGSEAPACTNRLARPVAAEPIPLEAYDFDNYLWRLDFFEIQSAVAEDRRMLWSPEDFLLAYWLGRYHGLLRADQ